MKKVQPRDLHTFITILSDTGIYLVPNGPYSLFPPLVHSPGLQQLLSG